MRIPQTREREPSQVTRPLYPEWEIRLIARLEALGHRVTLDAAA